jgi:chromosome segregation ATPase
LETKLALNEATNKITAMEEENRDLKAVIDDAKNKEESLKNYVYELFKAWDESDDGVSITHTKVNKTCESIRDCKKRVRELTMLKEDLLGQITKEIENTKKGSAKVAELEMAKIELERRIAIDTKKIGELTTNAEVAKSTIESLNNQITSTNNLMQQQAHSDKENMLMNELEVSRRERAYLSQCLQKAENTAKDYNNIAASLVANVERVGRGLMDYAKTMKGEAGGVVPFDHAMQQQQINGLLESDTADMLFVNTQDPFSDSGFNEQMNQ